MDDATLQRVCGLATAFRQSAHLLLDHHHKLSLDTWTLCEIQEAFSLILEIEQHTNFHVLPPNHRQHPAIPQLQFIYDLLQKVTGLRLWAKHGHSLPANETTSLRCFRSLQALELDHVPVTTLKALQTLRPTLKSIISIKGLTKLSDLFIRCGADKAGEFVWDQLQEAVLAHNSLHALDHSLSLLPKLRILDLSHCELEDASALEYLPSVTHIDISHNLLRLIPKFSETAQYSLIALVASNNLFSHIEGLQNMSNLEELDLRDNVLTLHDVLSPVGALPHLRVLKFIGNPVTYNQNYRVMLIKQLNPATANHEMYIDGVALSAQEEPLVGESAVSGSATYSRELLSSLSSLSSFCSPVNFLTVPDVPSQPLIPTNQEEDLLQEASIPSQPPSLTQETLSSSVRSTGGGQQRRKLRKKRTRQIAIAEPDKEYSDDTVTDGTSDGILVPHSHSLLDDVPNPPPPSLAAGPLYLPVCSDTVAQAITTLTCQEDIRSTVPEQSDRLLEQILQEAADSPNTNTYNLVTEKSDVVEKSDVPTDSVKEQAIEESCTSIDNEADQSLEVSRDSSIFEDSSRYSGQLSDTPPESESEDEKENCLLILGRKETKKTVRHASLLEDDVLNIEENLVEDDIIVAITSMYFKEKNSLTARTIYKWDLCCVESMELLGVSPHKVLITFDTIKSTYKKRTYVFESADYQQFSATLSPILEKNTLEKVLDTAMTCLKCNTQFSRELAKRSDGSNLLKCPNCGGGVVVRVERVDHPAISEASFEDGAPRSSTPVTQALTQASCPPTSDLPSGPGESSESVSVCSEASSCVRRESDVEVISNPSISSIEVLNDQQVIHDVILEEEGDEEENPPPPAAVNSDARTPANSPSTFHKPESGIGMQESSSSGSMTGSVCTTYEKSGSLPTSPVKATSTHHRPSNTTDSVDSKSLTLDSLNGTSALYKTAESSLLSTTVYGTPPHSAGSSPRLFSSSSTSIDTIKNDSVMPTLHHKAVMTSVIDDEEKEADTPHNLTSWVQSLLHTLTGYGWLWWEEVENVEGVQRIANPIRYSYEDFSDVDHRLQLHCEVLMFHEPEERLLGLVKAVLLVKGGLREFQGILVVSNKKIYVTEIVGPEDDSPQTWLEERSSHSLTEFSVIHSLYQRQGVGLTLGETIVLISLADSHRANCFFNFFLECVEEYGISPNIQECSPAQEESLMEIIKESHSSLVEESSLSMFAIVSILLDGGCSESQFLTMTSTDLYMFHANLEWYMPPSPDSKLKLNITQKIANIIAIEVHSDRHLGLQFLDEATGTESSWELHVTTPVAACHIIQAIRTPWTHLFSVDLEDFIGIYRTKEGDLLSMTRMSMEGDTMKENKDSQAWCQVSAVYGKLKYDPKYPILGYSDGTTPVLHEESSHTKCCDEVCSSSPQCDESNLQPLQDDSVVCQTVQDTECRSENKDEISVVTQSSEVSAHKDNSAATHSSEISALKDISASTQSSEISIYEDISASTQNSEVSAYEDTSAATQSSEISAHKDISAATESSEISAHKDISATTQISEISAHKDIIVTTESSEVSAYKDTSAATQSSEVSAYKNTSAATQSSLVSVNQVLSPPIFEEEGESTVTF